MNGIVTAARRGFTLIELLIALAIFVLLVLLAGPMYGEFMANAQIRNASESLLDGVRLAQAQAMKNNLPAIFTLDPATGWTVTVVDPEDAKKKLFTRTHQFADGSPLAVVAVTPNGATELTFDGLGRLMPNADATSAIESIDITHSAVSGARALRIVAAGTKTGVGTLMCDPAASAAPMACP
jgi:type IV fimbrial biogenesis protein FimT